jgi:hypothetical protein
MGRRQGGAEQQGCMGVGDVSRPALFLLATYKLVCPPACSVQLPACAAWLQVFMVLMLFLVVFIVFIA